MNVNKVTLSGRLTRDGEVKQTGTGNTVVEFGICVNDRKKTATGEWEDVPNFFECSMFGARAQALFNNGYLLKGAWVLLEGRLKYRAWTAQDGSKRSAVSIMVENVDTPPAGRREPQSVPQEGPKDSTIADEDIPF